MFSIIYKQFSIKVRYVITFISLFKDIGYRLPILMSSTQSGHLIALKHK